MLGIKRTAVRHHSSDLRRRHESENEERKEFVGRGSGERRFPLVYTPNFAHRRSGGSKQRGVGGNRPTQEVSPVSER